MAYRIAKLFGFEFLLSLDDRARSGFLWQNILRPAATKVSQAVAFTGGAAASLTPSAAIATSASPPLASPTSPEARRIFEKIQGIEWYHTIDLGHGIETPGRFNHRPLVELYKLPASLEGKRVLDVATNNGFWAFELERRGAREVIAVDVQKHSELDVPPRERPTLTPEKLGELRDTGFHVAKEILGSKAIRRNMSVYDVSPETVGKFDFVFCGDLLLHLMNPVQAAANICSVTSGEAYIVDCYSPFIPQASMIYQGADQGTWWGFSFSALERILRDAGFKKVELLNKFKAPANPGQGAFLWRAVFRCSN
jgi:tRNA (mo5U34)-methyltransferase